jgi:hypothetical protein
LTSPVLYPAIASGISKLAASDRGGQRLDVTVGGVIEYE